MIIELTESATRLAESEREDAWREMAKQVAHEIKNPLTPMKLSIQNLQMRWLIFDEKERQERFDSFAKNLIQQIDTLSVIAGEFSSFAVLGETEFKTINLSDIIKSAVDIYNRTNGVEVIFDNRDELIIYGDKDQMLRVFNNLIKNAVQSIPSDRNGLVRVFAIRDQSVLKVFVEDNGAGIIKLNHRNIFVPNFTTKSSGMGLGLAMVQKIIENMGAKIYFETEEGLGTKFIIELEIK
jgi:nitrogen fixation/metabolism regulation signal transduction histidine kinase